MEYIDMIIGNRSIEGMVTMSALEEGLKRNGIFHRNSFDTLLKRDLKDDETLIILP